MSQHTVSWIFGLMMMGAITGLVTTHLDDDSCSRLNDKTEMIKLCLEVNEQMRQILIYGWIIYIGSIILIEIMAYNQKKKESGYTTTSENRES